MAVQMREFADGKVVEIGLTGRLTAKDYEKFVPELESLVRRFGRVSLLFEMHDFHGWTMGALWEDIKFDVNHFSDIDRLAIVGEKKWQKGMAAFCKPFTKAEIKYFDRSELEAAREWIGETSAAEVAGSKK